MYFLVLVKTIKRHIFFCRAQLVTSRRDGGFTTAGLCVNGDPENVTRVSHAAPAS